MENPTSFLCGFKLAAVIVGLSVLWSWESWQPFFAGRRGRTRHAVRNLGLALVNVLCLSLVFAGVTVGVADWTMRQEIGLLHGLAPAWLQVVLAGIALDAWMYVWHRLNHAVPLLWRFHRTHHSDPDMDATTGLRFHLGELALSALARLGLVVLLGLRLEWILAYELVLLPVVLFHHSNVGLDERWDRCLRWLIVTPNMHRVHHSRWRPETDSNYASVLSVWDRLFRSFRLRDNPATIRLGLAEFVAPRWQTWWGLWRTPFVNPAEPPPEPEPALEPVEEAAPVLQ